MKSSTVRRALGLLLLVVNLTLLWSNAGLCQTRISSEGTDFTLGILPIGNIAAGYSGSIYNPIGQTLLISGFDTSTIEVFYFDSLGREILDSAYVMGNSGLEIPVNSYRLFPYPWDPPRYKALHIRSSSPVSISVYSSNNDNGEMTLLFPTSGLSTRYVTCSYNNAVEDAQHYKLRDWNALPGRSIALLVAAYDQTHAVITPSCALTDGSAGSKTILLQRGQVYLIEADTTAPVDLSGTVISSDKPVAVFSGNTNATLPDFGGYQTQHPADNFRGPVEEEMIPVDSWDSTGYVSIPFFSPYAADVNTPNGLGDMYRFVSLNTITPTADPVQSSQQLSPNVVEYDHISSAQHFSNLTGLVSAQQFDYFSGLDVSAGVLTFTTPFSCNLIPISHWKKQYSWIAPQNSDYKQGQYANIIYQRNQLSRLKLTNNGLTYPLNPLASFEIPLHPELLGMTIRLDPGMYRISSDEDLIVYNYGRTENALKFAYGYATPCGLTLSTKEEVPMSITVDTLCDGFTIHIHDARGKASRINQISLYTDSVAARKAGVKYSSNVSNVGTLPSLSDSDIIFRVLIVDPSKPAQGFLYVRDGLHGEFIIPLTQSHLAARLNVSQVNLRVLKDLDTCVNLVLHNYDNSPVIVTSTQLLLGSYFTLNLGALSFPFTLPAHDSLLFRLCGRATDHDTVHLDTLIVDAGCTIRMPCAITGLQPRINWDRDAQTDTLLCGMPDTVRVILTNNSASHATEVIEDVYLSGADSAEFEIVDNQFSYSPLKNFPIDYGESMWIDIAFRPDMSKPVTTRWLDRHAFLVAKNALHSDPVMALTAHVTYGDLTTNASGYDFGLVPLHAPKSTVIDIANPGTADVTITRIDNPDPSLTISGIQIGDRITAGQSKPITIIATANSLSLTTATIDFYGDGICVPPAHLTFTIQGSDERPGVQTSTLIAGLAPTYSCAHTQAQIVIRNVGGDTLRILRANIRNTATDFDSSMFELVPGGSSQTIDTLLKEDSSYLLNVDYHPTASGNHSAILEYQWDSLGTTVVSKVRLAGNAIATTSALAESAQGIDTVYSSVVAVPFTIPIYLVKDLPGTAVIQKASISVSFQQDLFTYLRTDAAGKYAVVASNASASNGITHLSIELSADTISASGKLCDVMLLPNVASFDTSGFRVDQILCTAFDGDTICTNPEIHPAFIHVFDLCGDSILRAVMAGKTLQLKNLVISSRDITMQLDAPQEQAILITITDMLGRTCARMTSTIQGNTNISIPTQAMPAGNYEATIVSAGVPIHTKFCILR